MINSLKTINLPVQSMHYVIDFDDPFLEKKIEPTKRNQEIQTLCTTTSVPDEFYQDAVINGEVPQEFIEVSHFRSTICSIEKNPVKIAPEDVKFFDVSIELADGRRRSFIAPNYMKFYSSHAGIFVPIELLRTRTILKDYAWRDAKVLSVEEHPDYSVKEVWSIAIDGPRNLYVDGILVKVDECDYGF